LGLLLLKLLLLLSLFLELPPVYRHQSHGIWPEGIESRQHTTLLHHGKRTLQQATASHRVSIGQYDNQDVASYMFPSLLSSKRGIRCEAMQQDAKASLRYLQECLQSLLWKVGFQKHVHPEWQPSVTAAESHICLSG
jgi:hypothetical protein